jgi:hypothetical protein
VGCGRERSLFYSRGDFLKIAPDMYSRLVPNTAMLPRLGPRNVSLCPSAAAMLFPFTRTGHWLARLHAHTAAYPFPGSVVTGKDASLPCHLLCSEKSLQQCAPVAATAVVVVATATAALPWENTYVFRTGVFSKFRRALLPTAHFAQRDRPRIVLISLSLYIQSCTNGRIHWFVAR